MPRSFLVVVVLSLFLSWSAGDQVSSDAITTEAAASPSFEADVAHANDADHVITAIESSGTHGKQADVLETTSQLASDSVTPESPAVPSSSAALDIGTLTTVEGTTSATPLKTTDTIEFRVLVGLSCKWVDGEGVERQSRVCPLESTCQLGPVTIVKKSGLDQRLYFCTGEQQLLVSIACRLEDNERVVVLPRCMAGSRCSIGPLALSYRGRQVRGYFCDAQMLPPSSGWTDREAADTWTASGRSQLDRHREEEPRRSSNLPTFNGGKSENDNDNGKDKDWMQDDKDHGKDGDNHEGDDSDNDVDHVHHGPQDREGERYTTMDALDEATITSETPTAETFDRKRVPGTTA